MMEIDGLFLNSVYHAFVKRDRSFGSDGRYEFENATPITWFMFRCSPAGRPSVLLTVNSTQSGAVLIRSTRGKNILALRGIQFVDNADAIACAFERTLDESYYIAGDTVEAQLRERIISRWKQVSMRIRLD